MKRIFIAVFLLGSMAHAEDLRPLAERAERLLPPSTPNSTSSVWFREPDTLLVRTTALPGANPCMVELDGRVATLGVKLRVVGSPAYPVWIKVEGETPGENCAL